MQITFRLINVETERYYKLDLQKDLLGDWLVIRVWGSLHTHHGGYRTEGFTSFSKAMDHVSTIMCKKTKNGYQ